MFGVEKFWYIVLFYLIYYVGLTSQLCCNVDRVMEFLVHDFIKFGTHLFLTELFKLLENTEDISSQNVDIYGRLKSV